MNPEKWWTVIPRANPAFLPSYRNTVNWDCIDTKKKPVLVSSLPPIIPIAPNLTFNQYPMLCQ